MWQLFVDTGGTFTDCLALDPQGTLHRAKVLSSATLRVRVVAVHEDGWIELDADLPRVESFLVGFQLRRLGAEHSETICAQRDRSVKLDAHDGDFATGETVELLAHEEAPLLAARVVTGTPRNAALPAMQLRLATTRGTNALLEGNWARAALLVTRGFQDVLRIGTQQRPELFAHPVSLPPPLIEHCVEIDERIDARGEVLQTLDAKAARALLLQLRADGFAAVAVALVHSVRNPEHELALEALAHELGFAHVSVSHRLAAQQGHFLRAQTCAVDAVLRPILREYLDVISRTLPPPSSILALSSAGGLIAAGDFAPKDGLLSGPAGGAMGAAAVAAGLRLDSVLSFDMGGTSTDVARIAGTPQLRFTHRVGTAELRAPAVAVETVAAGGGSICWIERGLPQVGPKSAGAVPGPACYGAGGPFTVTDVNLLLGRLVPEQFPIPLDLDAARTSLCALLSQYERESGQKLSQEIFLAGLLRIANERMADAIRRVSVREGYDPASHALVAFGGAAGQHACAVADLLGITAVVLPADASLLSAYGLAHARREALHEREILRPLGSLQLDDELASGYQAALAQLRRDGVPEPQRGPAWWSLRYFGQDTTLEIEAAQTEQLQPEFEAAYERRFGHRPAQREIEVVALRCLAQEPAKAIRWSGSAAAFAVERRCELYIDGSWRSVPVLGRGGLRPGNAIRGPALIIEAHSVAVLPAAWSAQMDSGGALLLRRRDAPTSTVHAFAGGIERELIRQRLSSIALEMGEMLRRTAISTNIKEREDFSCALLDAQGQLVVNAPHIPVHLGALGHCVRSVVAVCPMAPGDAVLTNHPGLGGSHLPDLTVISPVHTDAGELLGYVASRAHHAEIGGIVPGSMPAKATRLIEEGVVFAPTHLARAGVAEFATVERALREAPWPSRNIADNLADLRAMLAANRRGVDAFAALARQLGAPVLHEHIDALHQRAAATVRERLQTMGEVSLRAASFLDDGSPLRIHVQIVSGRARFDFSGSAGEHPGNLNANLSIVRSAVLYVLRLWVGGELPFNEGLMDPIELVVPPGMLSPDFSRPLSQLPAVVGGNVETSQQLVELLMRALDLGAASQGTMNNLSFGNERFGYYETLGGGCGATATTDGASGVHSHMTNTRITDVEVIEHRYPVRVRCFALRRGSGGMGVHRGGDGLVREIEFLQPATLSLLAQSRNRSPRGAHGGRDGAAGLQWLRRADDAVVVLQGCDEVECNAGDLLHLETPGGGGFGRTPSASRRKLASRGATP